MNPILRGVGAVSVVAAAMAWGCSSSTNETVVACDAGDGDSGVPVEPIDAEPPVDAASSDAAPRTDGKNSYGVAYPTKHLGYRVRTMLAKGSVIPNLQFAGYARGDAKPSTVEMADVFDPEGRTHDIVGLVLVGSWDVFSKEAVDKLKAKPPARVAVVLALGEGPVPSQPATAKDLGDWWTTTNAAAWYALDSGFVQLNSFVDVDATPVFVVLDARTMEIVSSATGEPSDPTATLEAAAAEVKARPKSY